MPDVFKGRKETSVPRMEWTGGRMVGNEVREMGKGNIRS